MSHSTELQRDFSTQRLFSCFDTLINLSFEHETDRSGNIYWNPYLISFEDNKCTVKLYGNEDKPLSFSFLYDPNDKRCHFDKIVENTMSYIDIIRLVDIIELEMSHYKIDNQDNLVKKRLQKTILLSGTLAAAFCVVFSLFAK